MPIYYPDILEETYDPQTFSYNDQQVMLYAVGVGMGADPLDARELPFVYERRLKVLPTAATVLAHVPGVRPRGSFRPTPKVPSGRRISEPNMQMLVHGSQRIVLHKALPPAGTFTAQVRILDVWDKGPGRGAILYTETVWTDAEGDEALTLTSGYFFRGDGGCGARTDAAPAPHAMPDRAPDRTVEIATRPDQALVYRLNGDRNPIHCDPELARKAGFLAPILHGYCTYGLTCRAILQSWCDYDPLLIASHEVRFSAPVYPGETLAMDMWRDGEVVSFEVRAAARDVTVIKHGKTVLRV